MWMVKFSHFPILKNVPLVVFFSFLPRRRRLENLRVFRPEKRKNWWVFQVRNLRSYDGSPPKFRLLVVFSVSYQECICIERDFVSGCFRIYEYLWIFPEKLHFQHFPQPTRSLFELSYRKRWYWLKLPQWAVPASTLPRHPMHSWPVHNPLSERSNESPADFFLFRRFHGNP